MSIASEPAETGSPPVDFAAPGRAWLVGIAGSGMRSLAALLAAGGWRVGGTDRRTAEATEILGELAPRSDTAFAALAPASCDIVITSPAIANDDPRVKPLAGRGIPVVSLVDAIAGLIDAKSAAATVVAGTHGKSTTAAILSEIFCADGRDHSAWYGGHAVGETCGVRSGEGRDFIVEGCEYRRHFLRYRAAAGVITSVEPDHFDAFDRTVDYCDAFGEFARRIDADGVLVVNAADHAAVRVGGEAACRVVSYRVCAGGGERPIRSPADWNAVVSARDACGQSIQIAGRGGFRFDVRTPLHGSHNAENVTAAAVIAMESGTSERAVADGVARFRGLRRRFEIRGEWRGRTVVDDYAHHPTAIRRTLVAVRSVFPGRRVVAVFEPHQASRLRALMPEFAEALASAERVVLTDVFAARETFRDDDAVAELAARIVDRGRPVRAVGVPCDVVDPVVRAIHDASCSGDVVVTLGAGRVAQVTDALSRDVRLDHPG